MNSLLSQRLEAVRLLLDKEFPGQTFQIEYRSVLDDDGNGDGNHLLIGILTNDGSGLYAGIASCFLDGVIFKPNNSDLSSLGRDMILHQASRLMRKLMRPINHSHSNRGNPHQPA